MTDIDAIRRLLALYGQLLDSRRFEDWAALFTEDASFRVWGHSYRGRDEIQREICGMQPDRPGKHVVLQPVIEIDDSNHARAWTDLTALASDESGITIATIGRYHDRLVRDEALGRWQIRERVLVMGGEEVPADVDPTPAY